VTHKHVYIYVYSVQNGGLTDVERFIYLFCAVTVLVLHSNGACFETLFTRAEKHFAMTFKFIWSFIHVSSRFKTTRSLVINLGFNLKGYQLKISGQSLQVRYADIQLPFHKILTVDGLAQFSIYSSHCTCTAVFNLNRLLRLYPNYCNFTQNLL
jgi:hypothetical protein